MIFALPLYDDNPTVRAPLITYVLIGLCTGAFLWELGQNENLVFYAYGMVPAVLFGHAHLPDAIAVLPAWATLFTSMFLHGGWWHLIGNMLFLWIFGNNIEDVLGRARYVLLYLACGLTAALSQALVSPFSTVPMVGASGAIAGVLGAYLLLYPRANVHCFIWIILFFRIINVPAFVLLGLWFTIQLVSGLAQSSGAPGVAFWAHVGGFLSGLGLVILLRPRGVGLLQPARSTVFAAVPPSAFAGRHRRAHGSVPRAGRRRPGPWG